VKEALRHGDALKPNRRSLDWLEKSVCWRKTALVRMFCEAEN